MKISDEEFRSIISAVASVRQALAKMGLKEAGGNYLTIKHRIQRLGLSTAHFGGYGHLKGKKNTWHLGPMPIEKVLVENSPYKGGSYKLKNRLIKLGLLKEHCNKCGNTHWLGEPIPLELEHSNGNNRDNRIENLELLCPNCHAFTPTYRGKNKGRVVEMAYT